MSRHKCFFKSFPLNPGSFPLNPGSFPLNPGSWGFGISTVSTGRCFGLSGKRKGGPFWALERGPDVGGILQQSGLEDVLNLVGLGRHF